MRRTLAQSLEVIVDAALEVVLNTSIARFVVVSRASNNIAP